MRPYLRAILLALSIWSPANLWRVKLGLADIEDLDPFELIDLSTAWSVGKIVWID